MSSTQTPKCIAKIDEPFMQRTVQRFLKRRMYHSKFVHIEGVNKA